MLQAVKAIYPNKTSCDTGNFYGSGNVGLEEEIGEKLHWFCVFFLIL